MRITAEQGRRFYFIDAADIEYIESNGNYVDVHTQTGSYMARSTLHRLAATLAPAGFVRIERSLLVNLRNVVFAVRLGKGRYEFALRSGKKVASSHGYRKSVLALIRDSA